MGVERWNQYTGEDYARTGPDKMSDVLKNNNFILPKTTICEAK